MNLHSTLLLLALLFLPLLLILYFHKESTEKKSFSSKLKPYPLIGILPQFIKNRHRFVDWTTEILAESPTHTMSFQMPGDFKGIITADPVNAEHMLKTNFDNYPRGENTKELLADFVGNSITVSDGEEWRWQRSAAINVFNKRSVKNFILETVQFEIVDRLIPLLKKFENRDETINLEDVLARFAFDNVCMVAFNEDPACLSEESMKGNTESTKFMKAFEEAQTVIIGRIMSPFKLTWKIKKLLNIGSERRMRESIAIINNYATRIIQERKEKKNLDEYHDILSSFATNRAISDEFLRDTVISFILAGRESTSSALIGVFWIILTRQDVKEKILDEIRKTRELNNLKSGMLNFDCLWELHYLHASITESLRLYPPLPFDFQFSVQDDELPDGTSVPKGWFMGYNSYAMGRMEHIWGKDCKIYRPERWLENGVFKPENPFRYPVFHGGPRMCVGREMAYIQMKLIVASLLENFELNVAEKEAIPEVVVGVTLKMKGGLKVKISKKANEVV